MSDQKVKIVQFEYGFELLQNIDESLNIYTDAKQVIIEHDGEREFSTAAFPIPPKSTDWRTIKVTVNGMSFYEYEDFTRDDDGKLTWLNGDITLKKDDIIFVEYTVDGSRDFPFDGIEELDGLLYVVVGRHLVTVEYNGECYPLVIEIGIDGDVRYYIIKDGGRQYFKINAKNELEEVSAP